MKAIVIAGLTVSALLLSVAAAAQDTGPPPAAPAGNPAGANPATPAIETGRPAQDTANAQDQLFLRQIHIGNTAEVTLGNLAKTRAASEDVKAFAGRMTGDHGDSLGKLRPLMRRSSTPEPKDLDMDHKVVQGQLEKLRGEAFDTAYIRSQIIDHQRTVQLLQWQIGFGQSDAIKTYSKQNLPIVLDHLETAKALHAKLTGAAP